MGTHNELIQEWFGNTAPSHYFHNGEGTEWYVFRNSPPGAQYLIMLAQDNGPLRAVSIANEYKEVTDLYNWIKVQHPNAEWLH